MMDLRQQRRDSRLSALAFVLSHGDELPGGDDCEALTESFAYTLRDFECFFMSLWPRFDDAERFQWAYRIAGQLLEDEAMLKPLARILDTVSMVGWRIELARFLLCYMRERYGEDGSLKCLTDYFLLINRTIANEYEHRGYLLDPDVFEYSEEPLHLVYNLN